MAAEKNDQTYKGKGGGMKFWEIYKKVLEKMKPTKEKPKGEAFNGGYLVRPLKYKGKT